MKDFDAFTKIAKNVGDLAKLIDATGLKSCPKCNKLPNLITLYTDRILTFAPSAWNEIGVRPRNNL